MLKSKRTHVWLFFASVYILSGLLWAPVVLSGRGIATPINKVLVVLVAFTPSVAGIVFTYLSKDRAARSDFWRRVFRWPRGHTWMAIAALSLLPILEIVCMVLPGLWGEPLPPLGYAFQVLRDWKMLLQFLAVEFFLGAVSEELGWRGYALDELQSRWSALKSSLVLGFIWAIWHTPAFLVPGLSQYEWGGIFSWPYVAFILAVTAASTLHTWAYNNTGRSILVAGILMHFLKNAAVIFMAGIFDQFAVSRGYWIVLPAVYILVVAVIVAIWGPETLARQPGARAGTSQPSSPVA